MKKRPKQLVTFDRADVAGRQHNHPCSDCPFLRTSLPGWLGGSSPEEYRSLAHSDVIIECHAVKLDEDQHAECAGAAVYRANVVKRAPEGAMELVPDKEHVFATPMEFVEHHSGAGWKTRKARGS